MATEYKIAAGHNNAAGLTLLDPQPRTPGLFIPRLIATPSGEVYEDGAYYTEWVYVYRKYTYLFNSQEGVVSLLSQTGLSSASSALVTVRLRENDGTWFNANATIIRPRLQGDFERIGNGLRDIRFRITNIVKL